MHVVIVGAGPAGLVLAHILQRAGVSFTVLERRTREGLPGAPKAGSIDFRTVEMLTSEGLAPDLVRFEVANGVCEFRTPGRQVVFDYGALTGGRPHFIYPQHLLVEALGAALVDSGADIRFSTTVTAVHEDALAENANATETAVSTTSAEIAASGELVASGGTVETAAGPTVTVVARRDDGVETRLAATIVVGADGARSAVAAAVGGEVIDETHPMRLLAVVGETPPLAPRTIYASHPDGYAAQMRRTPTHTRFYLDIPLADTIDDWPADRVRAAVARRLGVGDALDGVAITDPSIVELKTRMRSTMQSASNQVFLAGDAAHVITPFGGKGMNLGIADAVELAHGIIEAVGDDSLADESVARLKAYTRTRLPAIWRTQAFSNWMLRTVLAASIAGEIPGSEFRHGIGAGWIDTLEADPLFASWFAHTYAGADPQPI